MSASASWISKKAGRCGGDACVRDTRITVWGLVEYRRLGVPDDEILRSVAGLAPADLEAAWEYAAAHPAEIERSLWENEAAMVEHDERDLPWGLVRRGRELGLSDDEIRDAFDPPLTQDELTAALSSDRES